MNPATLLLLAALASADEPAAREDPNDREYYAGGIAVSRVIEQDPGARPDLRGFRLGFAAFSEGEGSRFGHAGSWYVEWKESRRQEVLEGGLEIAFPYFRMSRFCIGPRARLAIQDRDEPPHRGTDVVAGLGLELGLWISDRVHLGAAADRITGFDAGARTSYSAMLRVMLWGDKRRPGD